MDNDDDDEGSWPDYYGGNQATAFAVDNDDDDDDEEESAVATEEPAADDNDDSISEHPSIMMEHHDDDDDDETEEEGDEVASQSINHHHHHHQKSIAAHQQHDDDDEDEEDQEAQIVDEEEDGNDPPMIRSSNSKSKNNNKNKINRTIRRDSKKLPMLQQVRLDPYLGGKTRKEPPAAAMEDDDDDNEEDDEEEPRRKRVKHLAYAYVEGQAYHEHSTLSLPAQQILQGLLREQPKNGSSRQAQQQESHADQAAALEIVSSWYGNQRQQDDDDDIVMKKSVVPAAPSTTGSPSSKTNQKPVMTDLEIVQLSKADQVAFLGSFLAVLEQELLHQQPPNGADNTNLASVPAKVLIKRCCLAIAPKNVPAVLDAEEMAMAALEFLSSSFEYKSHHIHQEDGDSAIQLPLIQPVKQENDIKKRNYVKVGDWKYLDNPEFQKRIMHLERDFLSDPSSYTFLPRGLYLTPALVLEQTERNKQNSPTVTTSQENNDLDFLLRKGKHKVVQGPKRKQGAALRAAMERQAEKAAAAAAAYLEAASEEDNA